MKNRHPVSKQAVCGWRLWASWLCLALWLVSTPALMPLAVGAIGGLDGQHQVLIHEGRDTTRVVLHHAGGPLSAAHRHSVLSSVLVAFSQSERDSQDHLLIFPRSEAVVSEDPMEVIHADLEAVPQPLEWLSSFFCGAQLSQNGFLRAQTGRRWPLQTLNRLGGSGARWMNALRI